MRHKEKNDHADYARLKGKLYLRLVIIAICAFLVAWFVYRLWWHDKAGNMLVSFCQRVLGMDAYGAFRLYQIVFRNNSSAIWVGFITVTFLILLRTILNWFTRYLNIVNQGVDMLLEEEGQIQMPPEMEATERKMNEVRDELKRRASDARLAEQRKNDLVMYLAHDIRTPLTSVIGYLSLLEEAPDIPATQREKYIHITLEKANRLEKMIDEFFEITRYNLQQISIKKEPTDLYYMLVQMIDELSPVLTANGNSAVLDADENLTVYADAEKLARVFNNVLKNAAAYSFPNTQIVICAREREGEVVISFTNRGNTISAEQLSALFEKFYRRDEARTSNTGGAGLGLAIAREIVFQHGGTITAASEEDTVTFTITLPSKK